MSLEFAPNRKLVAALRFLDEGADDGYFEVRNLDTRYDAHLRLKDLQMKKLACVAFSREKGAREWRKKVGVYIDVHW